MRISIHPPADPPHQVRFLLVSLHVGIFTGRDPKSRWFQEESDLSRSVRGEAEGCVGAMTPMVNRSKAESAESA